MTWKKKLQTTKILKHDMKTKITNHVTCQSFLELLTYRPMLLKLFICHASCVHYEEFMCLDELIHFLIVIMFLQMCYWMLHNLTDFINLGNSFFAFSLYGLLSHRTRSGFVILHINSCVSIRRVGMRTWWFGGHWLLCKPLTWGLRSVHRTIFDNPPHMFILESRFKVPLFFMIPHYQILVTSSAWPIGVPFILDFIISIYDNFHRSPIFFVCNSLFSSIILIGMVVCYHTFPKRLNLLGNANYWVFAHGCVCCCKELIYAIVHAARLPWSPSEFWPVLDDWFESNIFKSYLWW